jgi:hypothetical protein
VVPASVIIEAASRAEEAFSLRSQTQNCLFCTVGDACVTAISRVCSSGVHS